MGMSFLGLMVWLTLAQGALVSSAGRRLRPVVDEVLFGKIRQGYSQDNVEGAFLFMLING